ncbi:hypothetical protein BD770DRAFT_407027 [Pilaira anomala]|nr:hypothetical protein BD770DRAFT_407027 [Pilaira anomala]
MTLADYFLFLLMVSNLLIVSNSKLTLLIQDPHETVHSFYDKIVLHLSLCGIAKVGARHEIESDDEHVEEIMFDHQINSDMNYNTYESYIKDKMAEVYNNIPRSSDLLPTIHSRDRRSTRVMLQALMLLFRITIF